MWKHNAFFTDQSSLGQAFLSYLKRLRWVPIPLGVGFAYISYQQYGHVREREERKVKSVNSAQDLLAKDWQVSRKYCFLKAIDQDILMCFEFIAINLMFCGMCICMQALMAVWPVIYI